MILRGRGRTPAGPGPRPVPTPHARAPKIWALLVGALMGLTGGAAALAPESPNFVFIITDDISPDDLGIYGNRRLETPQLARLAAGGLVFDNAYLTISSCSPSRCSIITGRYPHNTSAPELHTSLPGDQTTFVQVLNEAGYHTVMAGKNHIASPTQLGFDVYTSSAPSGAETWVQHLRDRPANQPFFYWFASYDAHYAWQIDDTAPTYGPDDVWVPPMLVDGPLTREELAGYYHEVRRTDVYLGDLLDELDRQRLADSTYVIYLSDNGRPFPRCKTYLYESGIKTPLLVAGPGVSHGRTGALVSSIDIAATILELAGLERPESIQGVSITPVLQNPEAVVRDVAFAERNWHVYQSHERAVRTGDWLYIWNAFPALHNVSAESSCHTFPAALELWTAADQGRLTPAQALLTRVPVPAEMLFHVGRDPYQFANLATDPAHTETLHRLRSLLARWQRETGDSVPDNPTPDRQPLHTMTRAPVLRGDAPGAAHQAGSIHHSGPVRLHP